MPFRQLLFLLVLLVPAAGLAVSRVEAPFAPGPLEVVTTAALVDDNLLYVASYEAETRAGHLRAFALNGSRRTVLWDAAERIPLPGAEQPPPVDPGPQALVPDFAAPAGIRRIFTNLDAGHGFALVSFEPRAAHLLRPQLGTCGVDDAAALINAVRGRLDTTAANPPGSGDNPVRLGAISRSSPALVSASPLDAAMVDRDQVLYVGAEDGLLHAVLAGRMTAAGKYDHEDPDCGRELWAYLPGTLLPVLAAGGGEAAGRYASVHVDGAPAVSDLFYDSDGDGRREWRTVLVGTASVESLNQGVVFALDVTDPHGPRLLWEQPLAEIGLGRSRGAAILTSAGLAEIRPQVFVTAGTRRRIARDGTPDPVNGRFGVLACAIDLPSGRLLWHFAAPYEGAVAALAEAPTAPSVMLAAASGGVDGVLFGDLAGRLWSLAPDSGAPQGDGPVWQSPGGAAEPIGGGLAVRSRLVLCGTGGVESADPRGSYAVYAVELLPEGGRLLWRHALEPGEQLWGAPTLDRFGRAFFGVGSAEAESGRVLVVEADGRLSGSAALPGQPGAALLLAPGAVIAVSRAGQVTQIGELRAERAGSDPGRVRVLSWRRR